MLQKAPQSLVRSALPPAVSRRGIAMQPLGFLLLIFVLPADFRKRVRKPSQTALCLCRACVYPIRGRISPHGAAQGLTDVALAAISMSLICTHLAYFRMLRFMGFGLFGFGTAEGETMPERISINSRTPAGTVLV